jgi:hypothetical protein
MGETGSTMAILCGLATDLIEVLIKQLLKLIRCDLRL